MSRSDLRWRWALVVFRSLLRFYPAEFRRAYGAEMERLFVERIERAATQGLLSAWRVVAQGWIDLGLHARCERARAVTRAVSSGDSMMTVWRHALRLALRSAWRQPGFSTVVMLTLAVSIGAVVTVMAVVEAAVLRPLPYPEPARLVSIVSTDAQGTANPLAPPHLQVLRDNTRSFDVVAGFSPSWSMVLTGRQERSLVAVYVSDLTLETFGVTPVSGRLISTDEHVGQQPVALVSESLWRDEFGLDPLTGGQTITLDGRRYTVVGILADDFRMPLTASAVNPTTQAAEVWLPFSLNPFYAMPTVPVMNVVARVRAGVGLAQADQELANAAAVLPTNGASAPHLAAVRLTDLVTRNVRQPLTLLLIGALCLLLICTLNIMSLVVARSTRRTGELAVRSALGASRLRLMLQLTTEMGVLTMLGTAAGVGLASVTLGALPALLVADLPPSARLLIDGRVLLGAVVLGALCAVGVGLWPAFQASKNVWVGANQLASRHTAGIATRRARQVLGVAQVALATLLLVNAGLMARSFWHVSHTDPGFRADGLFSTGLSMSGVRYEAVGQRRDFVEQAQARLGALPGVMSVAAVNRLPFSGSNTPVGVEIEGQPDPNSRPITMDRRVATPGYFRTIGLPVTAGRAFAPADVADSTEPVAILNEDAAKYLPGGAWIGQRVRLMLGSGPGPWLRVVGIVGNVRHHGLGQPVAPEVYVPYVQASVESMVFVMRSAALPSDLASPVRAALKAVDPGLQVLENQQAVVADLVEESIAEPRLHLLVVNVFAGLALALAAVGIVGIVSFGVLQQRREMGVRLALGAGRGGLVFGVVRNGMTLVTLGAGFGVVGGVMTGRSLEGLLFGVTAFDLPTVLAVSLVVAIVGLIAAYVPARRISGIEPLEILRPE